MILAGAIKAVEVTMDEKRKYLKDVLPRLYRETIAFLEKKGRTDLLEQLTHLYITGRCGCGNCADFHLDSDLPELNRESGSCLLYRPLYGEMDNGFYLGISGKEGLTLGEHDKSYVAGYDLVGGDYRDNYIHLQLQAHGFRTSKKLRKRLRPNSIKRRRSLKRRLISYKGTPANPLTPGGKYLRKRKAMWRYWKHRIY